MQHTRIALAETNAFTDFFIDYIERKEELKPFYHLFPEPKNFKEQILLKEKSFPQSHRDILVARLTKQYEKLEKNSHSKSPREKVMSNIASLKHPKTFTITTGHQLNIFTGPLFFIYKIAAVINACKQLKAIYPDYNFVPVFWMASEDHDYDEIKSFNLYGKKYTWETNQTGPVGRFIPKDIAIRLAQDIPGDIQMFRDAYAFAGSLADACRSYTHDLFHNDGLVVIDADDAELKALFKPVIREDVINQTIKPLVEAKNEKLRSLGYHTQVFARDTNFFYMRDGLRARIEKIDGEFVAVDTNIRLSQKQMEDLIESNPEKFSPNVILRPVYQEVILPNLAYVGGPAEMIYWLQLKGIFDHFSIPFPMLLPRTFALYIESQWSQKWSKTGLTIADLFKEKNFLFNHWVLAHTSHNLTVGDELKSMQWLMGEVKKRAAEIDTTLGPLVGAETTRFSKSLEKIERKMLRAEKRLHEEKLKQIETVKDVLFPGGKLQERTDNFLNFHQKDPQFVSKMVELLDPFDFRFNVVADD